jgi:hypothetical protein
MLRNEEYTLTVDSNKTITRSFFYFLLLHILYLQNVRELSYRIHKARTETKRYDV